MSNIPARCQALQQSYEAKKEFLTELEVELRSTTNPQERSRLLYLIRGAVQATNQAHVLLDKCLNPPPPLPNLKPLRFTTRRHADGKAFDVALVITNDGSGNTHGPFKVTLGLDYYTYGQDPPLNVFRELNITVPATAIINAGTSYTTEYWPNIPIVHRPGSTTAQYNLYALVDAERQVNETNESDNNLHVTIVM